MTCQAEACVFERTLRGMRVLASGPPVGLCGVPPPLEVRTEPDHARVGCCRLSGHISCCAGCRRPHMDSRGLRCARLDRRASRSPFRNAAVHKAPLSAIAARSNGHPTPSGRSGRPASLMRPRRGIAFLCARSRAESLRPRIAPRNRCVGFYRGRVPRGRGVGHPASAV